MSKKSDEHYYRAEALLREAEESILRNPSHEVERMLMAAQVHAILSAQRDRW